MSDVRETVLNNDDATHTLRVSKAECGLDGLTVEPGKLWGPQGSRSGPCEELLRLARLR